MWLGKCDSRKVEGYDGDMSGEHQVCKGDGEDFYAGRGLWQTYVHYHFYMYFYTLLYLFFQQARESRGITPCAYDKTGTHVQLSAYFLCPPRPPKPHLI